MAQVKTIITITLSLFPACAHLPSQALLSKPPELWAAKEYVHHNDWFALNVDFTPVEQIRLQLESILGQKLLSRGEAHITLITPPEYKVISPYVSDTELDRIAGQMKLQSITWQPVCLGRAVNPKNDKEFVYFLVIESPGLAEVRREIFRRYTNRSDDPRNFQGHPFSPHITIGYSVRDLHESDDIRKDRTSCMMDLTTPDGRPITHWNKR